VNSFSVNVVLDESTHPTSRVVDLGVKNAVRSDTRAGLLPCCGDDDDGEVSLQLLHEVFDARGRDRVERGAGLVHEHDVGSTAERARNAETAAVAHRQREPALA